LSNTVFLADHRKDAQAKSAPPKKGTIVVLIVLLVVLLISVLVLFLPTFRIREITVEGNRVISTEDIMAVSRLSAGDHILSHVGGGIVQLFTLRYGSVEDRLDEMYPYIRSVKVRVEFPSKVRITVVERQKIGYLDVPDGYAAIDTEGYVVEISSSTPPAGVPMIEGIPVKTAVLNQPMTLFENRGLDRCLVIFGAILDADAAGSDGSGFSLMSCVGSVRYVGEDINYLVVHPKNSTLSMLVKIGSLKDIYADMTWLRHAFANNLIDFSDTGVLDMTGAEYTMRQNN
jgi:hypothetical protein